MTLSKYLALTVVLSDVNELLASAGITHDGKHKRLILPSVAMQWDAIPDRAWTHVQVAFDGSRDVFEAVSCYYRRTANGFLISDRGETVSEVMRRTGKTWRDSLAFVHQIECLAPLDTERDADIKLDQVEQDGLVQAIVTVLSIVAKIREATP